MFGGAFLYRARLYCTAFAWCLRWYGYHAPGVQALALHYDVAHVSLLGALQRIITDDAAARLGITPWRLTSIFYEQSQHLSRDRLGGLVAADMLVSACSSRLLGGGGENVFNYALSLSLSLSPPCISFLFVVVFADAPHT